MQCPIEDASAQLVHAPPHAPSQQTPSTQNPLAHSPAPAQASPRGLGPQLPATHAWPVWQSASLAHDVTQAPPAQL